MRMATLPYAHGNPAIRTWQPSRVSTAALPCAHGGLPCAYGDLAVCVWVPCRVRMAALPCDHLIFRSSRGFSGRNYLPAVTEKSSAPTFDGVPPAEGRLPAGKTASRRGMIARLRRVLTSTCLCATFPSVG